MESSHIFLVGMMGSGKSTLGVGLAERLGWPFLDLDAEIEARTKMTIAELFAARGEFDFRACEAQMLREMPSRHPRSVIATGGGAPAHFDGMTYMNAAGRTVYLQLSLARLLERLRSERATRPLLAEPGWEETLELLFAQRAELYERAHLTLPTDGLNAEGALAELVERLK